MSLSLFCLLVLCSGVGVCRSENRIKVWQLSLSKRGGGQIIHRVTIIMCVKSRNANSEFELFVMYSLSFFISLSKVRRRYKVCVTGMMNAIRRMLLMQQCPLNTQSVFFKCAHLFAFFLHACHCILGRRWGERVEGSMHLAGRVLYIFFYDLIPTPVRLHCTCAANVRRG